MITKNWGFDMKNIDESVRPQDDFFHYASGGWIKKNAIPATESMWGSFSVLRQENRNKLKAIVEEVSQNKKWKEGSDEQMVRDIYLSGMDEAKREKDGAKPLNPLFQKINAIKKTDDIIPLVAHLHKSGCGGLFGFYIDQDERHNEKNIIYLAQSGLSLPDRDYYLGDDEDAKKVRIGYEKYVLSVYKLFGKKTDEAKNILDAVIKIETELARVSMTRVELRDIEKQYNKRTLEKLQKEAKGIAWAKYFRLVGIANAGEVIVSQPLFMKRVSELLTTVTLEEWKAYFHWHVLNASLPFLNKKYIDLHFGFYSATLSGTKKQRPLWEKVVMFIDGSISEALGKLYVARHFDAESKMKINELVDNLFVACREHIERLDWMTEPTKKLALKKLSSFKRKLGYPDKWKGYRGLTLKKTSFIEVYWAIHNFEWKRELKKLKKAPDLTEWHISAPTVNAYYNPVMNEIVFPAGIMQPPFFHKDADMAINYGGIGSVIGHEITHGFDDQGCQFDHSGNFKNWWTPEDKKHFDEKAKVIENQFSDFVAIDDLHVNGSLTLGENIADLGGLTIAYTAFKKSQEGKERVVIDGFTPEQRFFLGFAACEQEQYRPEFLKKTIKTDPHSPSIFRVNGALTNMPEFYEAWGIKRGDKLYKEKKDQAKIW